MPDSEFVVISGGIAGASAAYHLLERDRRCFLTVAALVGYDGHVVFATGLM